MPKHIKTLDIISILRFLKESARFSYIVGMGRLLMLQLHRVWIWSRDTMRRIIADIDTDGNGEIDWEEMHVFNLVRGGFKYVLFSPLFGEMIQFDEHMFQRGWNHQLELLYQHVQPWNQIWNPDTQCMVFLSTYTWVV